MLLFSSVFVVNMFLTPAKNKKTNKIGIKEVDMMYSRTGWGRTGAGPSSGMWGCTCRGSSPAAPSARHRPSSYLASTSHMTPKGRLPISTPWKVSDTGGRKFWRFLSYFRVIIGDASPRPSAAPDSDRLRPSLSDVTCHALAAP